MKNRYPAHYRRLFGFMALFGVVYAGIDLYFTANLLNVNILSCFLPLVVIVLSYSFGLFYDPVHFDALFFYPTDNHHKIPLSSIQAIKLTWLSNQFRYCYWKVTYLSDTGTLASVRVLPPALEGSFGNFIEAVRKANPTVDTDIYEFRLYLGFLPGTFCKRNKIGKSQAAGGTPPQEIFQPNLH